MKSSARHTLSNQQAQPEEAETVNLTKNVPKGHFQRLLVWVPRQCLKHYTIVCTINVSIDCDWFQVPNPFTRKYILK